MPQCGTITNTRKFSLTMSVRILGESTNQSKVFSLWWYISKSAGGWSNVINSENCQSTIAIVFVQ